MRAVPEVIWRLCKKYREIKRVESEFRGNKSNQNYFPPWLLLLTNTHEIRDLRNMVYLPVRHLSFKLILHHLHLHHCPIL